MFVLHTSLGHVTRTRPTLPAPLSVVHYVAMGPPALAPFVPVYRVCAWARPAGMPCALGRAAGQPQLFWQAPLAVDGTCRAQRSRGPPPWHGAVGAQGPCVLPMSSTLPGRPALHCRA